MTVMVADDLSGVPSERLEHEVAQHASAIAAATCRWLLMIAELDRREAYLGWECRSMAQWLSWKCDLDLRTGRDHVRVARALAELPAIREVFADGEITYSKVRAITRVATPDTEADLLAIARDASASQLDRIVGAYAKVQEQVGVRNHTRTLHVIEHLDGTVTIAVRRCSTAAASTILAAIDAALPDVPTGLGETYGARRVDALEIVATAFVAPDTSKPRPVEAHLDIRQGHPSEGGSAEPPRDWQAFVDGLAINLQTAEELACDASLFVAVNDHDGTIRFVKRATRIPVAARRHTHQRDGRRCRWPGCTNHRWLNVHHIAWRSRDGDHATSNLVALCTFHHRAVHHRGWEIIGDADGTLTFVAPDGRQLHEHAPALPRGRVVPPASTDGRMLEPPAYARMDLHYVISVLADRHYPLN